MEGAISKTTSTMVSNAAQFQGAQKAAEKVFWQVFRYGRLFFGSGFIEQSHVCDSKSVGSVGIFPAGNAVADFLVTAVLSDEINPDGLSRR